MIFFRDRQNIHTFDSSSDATEFTDVTNASGFTMIEPDKEKRQELMRIAKNEEILWEKMSKDKKIKSLHEINKLGGINIDSLYLTKIYLKIK